MKLKFSKIEYNIEELFLIISFIFILSPKVKRILDSYYLCYLFIVFHELSHIFIASLFCKKINRLNFTLCGLNVGFYYNYKKNKNINFYIKEIIINLAGPISNLILCVLFWHNKMIFDINICLAIINIMPIYPLDGYNVIKNFVDILYLKNLVKDKNIVKYINNIFFVFIIIIFIVLFLNFKNVSYLIFLVYITCYKMNEKYIKSTKIYTHKLY